MTPTVRYPAGPIVPHGGYHLLKGDQPMVALRSYDDTAVFNLAGPLSHVDRTTPESVQLKSLKGLMPPWKTIDQKGATQDGTTFIDALLDPIEVEAHVVARGRNPHYTRQVLRDLIAALDVKHQSELSWFTPEMGRWWAGVRWLKQPVNAILGAQTCRQPLTLVLRVDDGCWRSYDHADLFRFGYATASDEFTYTTSSELDSGWTVAYSGAGSGAIHANGAQVVSTLTGGRTAVCRKAGYISGSDNQVAEVEVGCFPTSWFCPLDVYVNIWVRLGNSGTAGANGVRLRIGHRTIKLSRFNSGTETVLRQRDLIIPALTGEKWTLIAGTEGSPRTFKLLRDGVNIFNVVEHGTGSLLGASYRSAGFGLSAGGTTTAPTVRAWSAGDNSTVSQSGFVNMVNVGDQNMWPRFTCFGPGTFSFANGPGSTDMVTFGPLLPNQVAQIRTHPSKRGVVNISSTPPTPQELNEWQQALKDFISFATANNVPPLLQEIETLFGIAPPQGNLYSLLHGRFSDVAAIPPKPAGQPAPPYQIKVAIDDGNADSQILAAGTPLRRMPY